MRTAPVRASRFRLRSAASKLLLLIASAAASLTVLELALRAFYPRYQYAAGSRFDGSPGRIWVRKRNDTYERAHPDSGRLHVVRHNNLALRHHRDIDEEALGSTVNIGVFGDSFTENLRLPGQYVFTEVLDYLLNRHGAGFNVLNLGVDGYGTDQCFEHYRDFEYSHELDHVFYVFCKNDVRNIYENGLYAVDPELGLVAKPAAPSPSWVRVASRLYTTYFLVEALQNGRGGGDEKWTDLEGYYQTKQRRRERDERVHDERADSMQRALIEGEPSSDLENMIAVFQSLLRAWKTSVEEQGGKFYVVVLPREKEHRARDLVPDGIDVINLYEAFAERIADYDFGDWRFEQDAHWNEAGNQLAAVALFRELEGLLGLTGIPEESLQEALYAYYASFDGWMPAQPFIRSVEVDPELSGAIRKRYGPPQTRD